MSIEAHTQPDIFELLQDAAELLPTIPGKVRGIVGWDPLRLQCGDCGAIHEQCSRSVGVCILTAGFEFHTCETGAPRRCPECMVRALTECGSMRCADHLEDARSRARRAS